MKNVIITGSSRGIGFELVNLFNQNNYNVIALSRNTSSISNCLGGHGFELPSELQES